MKCNIISNNINAGLKKQQGISLVGAIFIMVTLAAVGIAMVTLNSTTTTTSALNIEQARAFYAAQSAMEWAIKRVNVDDEIFSSDSCVNINSHPDPLENFSIEVTCLSKTCPGYCCSSISDCSLKPRVTTLLVTASKGSMGDTFYVFRQIEATVSYDGN